MRLRRLLCGLALAGGLAAAPALAHEGDPNMLSEVRSIEPAAEGLRVEVLNRDDRLLVVNRSGEDVVIMGYNEEPYARLFADGRVEVNTNSPAHYLNEDRYGKIAPPEDVTSTSPPEWKELSRSGRFEFHDHRMHWMGEGTPPQVTDESVRTKVFDWSVPMQVGGRAGAITGTLTWVPDAGGAVPAAAVAALAGVVLLLGLAVVLVRRRRGGTPTERPVEADAW